MKLFLKSLHAVDVVVLSFIITTSLLVMIRVCQIFWLAFIQGATQ